MKFPISWLNKYYVQIITLFIQKKLHPILLFKSTYNIGIPKLIYELSCFILCIKKKNFNYCNVCSSCIFMKSKKHPDFYIIEEKKKKNIGIDFIRDIIIKIYSTAQQSNEKILWFTNILKLTKEAINTLLKTFEEPPKNTFFFLYTSNTENIQKTLLSRMIIYNISGIKEKNALLWLKKKNKKKNFSQKNLITILRLYNSSPFSANFFLNNIIFEQRIKIIKIFKNYLFYKKNLLLINAFKYIYNPDVIFWICFILLDAIKLISKKKIKIQNIDQILFLKKIAKKYSYRILYKILTSWLKCNYHIHNIPGINKEIFIIEQVLYTTLLIKN
ncbi:DNA polymerase III subunit delta' C-terminal domain-containing protein [Buchnera aphidicola]|uniref:DNA polymerase III subunit delta' C-terminal domain-containing protein n=1 Tax=Buchnera aphidicola TaxID=9 RepID=UPI0031B6E555